MFYPDKKFVETLSEAEKFIFLKVICGLVASDRQVTKEELVYLKEVAKMYEVDGSTLTNMIKSSNRKDLLKQARMIDERQKALFLIKDLCVIANNDIDLEDNEIEYILDIAEVMGIDPVRVKDINTVVNSYIECEKNIKLLLEVES